MKRVTTNILLLFLLCMGSVLFLLSGHIFGFRAFIVTSGSMEPAIHTGSVILTHAQSITTLEKGNVIAFARPDNTSEIITHRIQETIQRGTFITFKTKGDNNKTLDPWTVAPGAVIGKVLLTIPGFGYFFAFTKTTPGLILIILLPTLFCIYAELVTISQLLKHHKVTPSTPTVEVVVLVIFMSGFFLIPSHALLSSSATLVGNQFTVSSSITPTPPTQMTDCDGDNDGGSPNEDDTCTTPTSKACEVKLQKIDRNHREYIQFTIYNCKNYKKLKYELTYDTDDAPQEIIGAENLLENSDSFTSQLITLGTCSTGNICRLDKNPHHFKLNIHLLKNQADTADRDSVYDE